MLDPSDAVVTTKQIAAELSEKNVPFMAAGIAYNAFISLAPMLVVLLVVISSFGGGLEDRLVELSRESFPGPIADVVAEVFQGGAADPAASFVGIVVLIWGTLKIFRGLDTAFSEIYETTGENSFTDKLMDGLVVFVAVLLAILATVGVTAVFARYADVIPYVGLLTPLVLVAGLIAAFYPIYHRFPDTDIDWRYALPGAAVAAVGWAAFQAVFQVYLSFTGDGSDSLFGGVIVVITWLYFSGLVLLAGAVMNAVLGGYTSGKAGGVGRGATSYETEREEEMSREEFVAYLESLRESLMGGSDAEHPPVETEVVERHPRPNGGVTVIEQSKPGDGQEELSVSFRWRTEKTEPEAERGSESDPDHESEVESRA